MQDPGFEFEGLAAEQCRRFDIFAEMLAAESKAYNLTTITEIDQIHSRHFADSLRVLPILQETGAAKTGARLIDIGSGAGFPGLAIAIALGDWKVLSLEATGKKVRFQEKVIEATGLENATAMQGRAEDYAHDKAYRERFDVATARAVASLDVLLELAIGFVRPGGHFIAWKGGDIEDELERGRGAAEVLGAEIVNVVPYRLQSPGGHSLNLVVVRKKRSSDRMYPRPYGKIKSSPLGGQT